jgi:hypothetical protein
MLRKILFILFLTAFIACSKDEPVNKTGYTLQGTIIEKGQGAAGISVSINNQVSATTNQAGEYVIENLDAGTYSVTPDQSGRSFLPSEKSVTITDQNVSLVDFIRAGTDQTIYDETIWNRFRQSVYSIKQNAPNMLQLDLEENALWYQNNQGGLIYRSINGNFTITAKVNAVRKSNNSQPVACNICLGGLMVRNANNSNGENYVHLVTGFTPDGLGVEFKSTTNGASVFDTSPDGSALHDLRIQRAGSTFTMYQKLPSEGNWNLIATYNRADLPAEVLVGVNIYTAQAGPVADLSVIFENIVIE